MFRIMSRNKYDSLIRENAELKNANANLEDKLDQLKAEKAVNSKYKCGEYCRACENGVVMLLAMLLHYIGPKRTRASFGALWIISLILLWVLILL